MLVWWWEINGEFLDKNLINEIFISLHPIILWNWIKLFWNSENLSELELISTKNLDKWLMQLHYKVLK